MSEFSVLEMLNKKEDESAFILLDGAVFPAMPSVYGYEVSPQVSPLYYGTRHEASLDVSPCLYKPSAKSKVWDHESDWRKNGLVFVSTYSYFEVLEHLKSLISVRLPNDQLAYWRFYSPEWLSMLINSFSREELLNFSGPVSQWAAYREGHWKTYKPSGHIFIEKNKEEGWFKLSRNCMARLKSKKKEEFYIRLEETLASHVYKDNFDNVHRECLLGIVSNGEKLGFKSNSELEWFVTKHYKHPEFMRSDEVIKLLGDMELSAHDRQVLVEEVIWGVRGVDQ